MFALLSPRKTRARGPQLARLCLEALEVRYAPATLTLSVTYGKDTNVTFSGDLTGSANPGGQTVYLMGVANGQTTTDANGHFSVTLAATALGTVSASLLDCSTNTPEVTLTDPGPKVDVFQALEGPGNLWEFKGHVEYSRPFCSFTINFGGSPISIMGKSTTTDSIGNFDTFIQLNGTSTDNGTATAFTYDAWGTWSSDAYQVIDQTGT
jgi:hypothetical protein